MFWVKSPFVGKPLISVPYGVYGGALAANPAVYDELFAAAERVGRQLGAEYVEFRHFGERPGERETNDLYLTFLRTLPQEVDEVQRRESLDSVLGRDEPGVHQDLVLHSPIPRETRHQLGRRSSVS